jgi:hypothetical protein
MRGLWNRRLQTTSLCEAASRPSWDWLVPYCRCGAAIGETLQKRGKLTILCHPTSHMHRIVAFDWTVAGEVSVERHVGASSCDSQVYSVCSTARLWAVHRTCGMAGTGAGVCLTSRAASKVKSRT